MEYMMLFHGALAALRQGSGVPTRRKVDAKSVYQGIVTRAANNTEPVFPYCCGSCPGAGNVSCGRP
jgi:hypothetical protein